jgi:type 1 fimbria pilin
MTTVASAIALLLVAAAQTAQAQSPSAPPTGIMHVQVTVAGANDEWTPTTLSVNAGDILLITAEGRVRLGQYAGEVGPNGADQGLGALQLKIGVGAAVRVGARSYLTVEQSGQVKLKVNDTRYDDNTGSFTVHVIVIPAELVPPAIIVPQ